MGYGLLRLCGLWHFSANRLGGPKNLWGIREYGLSELWVMRESTVLFLRKLCDVRLIFFSLPHPLPNPYTRMRRGRASPAVLQDSDEEEDNDLPIKITPTQKKKATSTKNKASTAAK